jgi:hypothetical protein
VKSYKGAQEQQEAQHRKQELVTRVHLGRFRVGVDVELLTNYAIRKLASGITGFPEAAMRSS